RHADLSETAGSARLGSFKNKFSPVQGSLAGGVTRERNARPPPEWVARSWPYKKHSACLAAGSAVGWCRPPLYVDLPMRVRNIASRAPNTIPASAVSQTANVSRPDDHRSR